MDPVPSCSNSDTIIDSKWTSKRDKTSLWTPETTVKLIETMESECREIWDSKHPLHKDRTVRHTKHEFLANMFDTTVEEITRKVHNLRTQFNSEIRKIKKRKQLVGEEFAATSSWEYFEPLAFLLSQNSLDLSLPEGIESVDIAVRLAEFQEEEQAEFRALRSPSSPPEVKRPLWIHAHDRNALDEPTPRLHGSNNADECQIFGDFVASELRMLRSDESRKRLKRIVQKAILQIGEEEDESMI